MNPPIELVPLIQTVAIVIIVSKILQEILKAAIVLSAIVMWYIAVIVAKLQIPQIPHIQKPPIDTVLLIVKPKIQMRLLIHSRSKR